MDSRSLDPAPRRGSRTPHKKFRRRREQRVLTRADTPIPIMAQVVRLSDIGGKNGVRSTYIVDPICNSCRGWGEQNICSPRAVGARTANSGRHACISSKIELAAGPGWVNPREMEPLIFKTSLEAMPTVDFGQILRELNRVTTATVGTCKRARAK